MSWLEDLVKSTSKVNNNLDSLGSYSPLDGYEYGDSYGTNNPYQKAISNYNSYQNSLEPKPYKAGSSLFDMINSDFKRQANGSINLDNLPMKDGKLDPNLYAQKDIYDLENKLKANGIDTKPKKEMGFVSRVLNALSSAGQGVTTGVYNLTDNDKETGFFKGLKDGFVNSWTGDEEKIKTGSDIISNFAGEVDGTEGFGEKTARFLGGLLLDIGLDPTTYLSGGTTALVKGSAAKGGKEIAEKTAKEIAQEVAGKSIKEGADKVAFNVDDVAKNVMDTINNKTNKAYTGLKLGLPFSDKGIELLSAERIAEISQNIGLNKPYEAIKSTIGATEIGENLSKVGTSVTDLFRTSTGKAVNDLIKKGDLDNAGRIIAGKEIAKQIPKEVTKDLTEQAKRVTKVMDSLNEAGLNAEEITPILEQLDVSNINRATDSATLEKLQSKILRELGVDYGTEKAKFIETTLNTLKGMVDSGTDVEKAKKLIQDITGQVTGDSVQKGINETLTTIGQGVDNMPKNKLISVLSENGISLTGKETNKQLREMVNNIINSTEDLGKTNSVSEWIDALDKPLNHLKTKELDEIFEYAEIPFNGTRKEKLAKLEELYTNSIKEASDWFSPKKADKLTEFGEETINNITESVKSYSKNIDELNRKELTKLLRENGLVGYSKMAKKEMVDLAKGLADGNTGAKVKKGVSSTEEILTKLKEMDLPKDFEGEVDKFSMARQNIKQAKELKGADRQVYVNEMRKLYGDDFNSKWNEYLSKKGKMLNATDDLLEEFVNIPENRALIEKLGGDFDKTSKFVKDYVKLQNEWAITEKGWGLLKRGALSRTYVPHRMSKEAFEQFGGDYNELVENILRGRDNLKSPDAKFDKKRGSYTKTVDDLNKIIFEETGVENYLEKDITKLIMQRAYEHNQALYTHSMENLYIKTIGQPITEITDTIKRMQKDGKIKIVEIKNIEDVMKENLTSIDDISTATPISWKEVGLAKEQGDKQYYYVSKEAYSIYEENIKQQVKKDGNAFLDLFDKATNIWKEMAIATPGFHAKNKWDNNFRMFLEFGGATLDTKYGDMVKKLSKGDLTEFVTKDGKKYSGDELKKLFETFDIGAEDTALVNAEFHNVKSGRKTFDEVAPILRGEQQPDVHKSFMGAYGKKMRQMGEGIEKTDRQRTFLMALDSGATPLEAKQYVDRILFDYSDMSDFEKTFLKRAMPFYTFFRKNGEFQLKKFIESPNTYKNIDRVMQNQKKATMTEDERRLLNDGDRNNFIINNPLGEGKLSINNNVSLTDMPKILSSLNPIIKTPLELSTNKNFAFDSPISNYDGDIKEAKTLEGMIGKLLGQAEEGVNGNTYIDKRFQHLLTNLVPLIRTVDNKFIDNTGKLASGELVPALANIMNFGGQEFDTDYRTYQYLNDYKNQLSNEVAKQKKKGVDIEGEYERNKQLVDLLRRSGVM